MKMGENQPYRKERRAGLGWLMIGTANLLQTVHDANLVDVKKEYNYNSFTAKEHAALLRVKFLMRWQIKALRAVAKSMGAHDDR